MYAKNFNVIVALINKCVSVFVCVREIDRMRGRGQMCVPSLVSYFMARVECLTISGSVQL